MHDSPRNNIIYLSTDVEIIGRNNYFPNCLLYSNNILYCPYDEKVMSLNKQSYYDNDIYVDIIEPKNNYEIIENGYFFIYNFDNYYHFMYDTLPYLINYFYLKKIYPELKLILNYPTKKNKFYEFNIDLFIFLKLDYIIHSQNNKYKTLYVSNSLTHNGKSNDQPNKCVYDFFAKIVKINKTLNLNNKIYISRRTWTRFNNDNIGTNYTTRRKNINEDVIVKILSDRGFIEVFTEDYSLEQKICMFRDSKFIVGAIGGGLCNLMFSDKNVNSLCIVSPGFLDINYRFKFSMESSNITYFYDCYHEKTSKITIYTRVIIDDKESKYYKKIGEIIEYFVNNNSYKINISNNDIVGFNLENQYETEIFFEHQFAALDNGLNSPYYVNEIKFINVLNNKLKLC